MPQPDDIRAFVSDTFAELAILPDEEQPAGETHDAPADDAAESMSRNDESEELSETILIRGGHYYGRSYRRGGLIATLVAETGRLEFYTQQGTLLRTVEIARIPRLPRVLTDVA